MMKNFPILSKKLCRDLTSAIHDTFNREVCGFLIEEENELRFRRMENLGGYGEFILDEVMVKLFCDNAGKNGIKVRYFVHNHFTGLELSSSDINSFCRNDWPWLIVMIKNDKISGKWYWHEKNSIHSQDLITEVTQNSFILDEPRRP
ncbi:MAG: hypothetical protein WCE54_13780 [Ignavibacteriaceae bacterium]